MGDIRLDHDWQSSTPVPQCFWVLFEKQVLCDVAFYVGTDFERVAAHSTILVARSNVFFSQFIRGLPEKEIELPEVQPEEFSCFLRFLYTGELKIDGISEVKVTFLAEKYEVLSLIRLLLSKQLDNMPIEEFCPFVKKNEKHMTDLVKFKCLEYVFKNPYQVFRSSTFTLLPKSFLRELLEHERLVLDEEVICTAVLLWASKACETYQRVVTGSNQRDELGDLVYLIRYPLLSQDYFTENISEKGLLTDHEEVQLLKYFLNKNRVGEGFRFSREKRVAPSTPFEFKPSASGISRQSSGLHTVESRPILSPNCSENYELMRFGERGIGWGYRDKRQDAVILICSRDIIITHVMVYGICKDDGVMDVDFKICDKNDVIASTSVQLATRHSHPTGIYEVGVENAVGKYGVRLTAKKEYLLAVIITGGNSFYGKSGKALIKENGVEFEFKPSDSSTNNSSPVIGQIPGFRYHLVHE